MSSNPYEAPKADLKIKIQKAEYKGKSKVVRLFQFWIILKIVDFILRLTIASEWNIFHIISNVSGIIVISLMFYPLIQGKHWGRLLALGLVTFGIIIGGVMSYRYGVDLLNFSEPYKMVTQPLSYLIIIAFYYLMLFDTSVKKYFKNEMITTI